jgi:dephospho-CoA kinase
MLAIGLTGGMGSGKSTVGHFLVRLGAKVIEADDLAHECFNKKWIQEKIVRTFGKKVLDSNGKVHKKKLAGVVFQDQKKLRRLEGILHPPVIQEIKKELLAAKRKREPMMVVIIPLLFEKRLEKLFDKTVAVASPKRLRILRAARGLKIMPSEVTVRMQHQLSSAVQRKMADFVIRNYGTKRQLKREVEKLIHKLKGGE